MNPRPEEEEKDGRLMLSTLMVISFIGWMFWHSVFVVMAIVVNFLMGPI